MDTRVSPARQNALVIEPCIPEAWRQFEIVFRYHSERYEITVENPRAVSRGVARVKLDGKLLSGNPMLIPLSDDGMLHRVRVILDEASGTSEISCGRPHLYWYKSIISKHPAMTSSAGDDTAAIKPPNLSRRKH
jgi:hypothetical protein